MKYCVDVFDCENIDYESNELKELEKAVEKDLEEIKKQLSPEELEQMEELERLYDEYLITECIGGDFVKNLKCEHIIGLLQRHDYQELVTLADLKEHIANETEFFKWLKSEKAHLFLTRQERAYTLAEYCDKRKTTDLERFNYCPFCGEKIDWKKIKEGKIDDDEI